MELSPAGGKVLYDPGGVVIITVPGLPSEPGIVLVPGVGPATTLVTVLAGYSDFPVRYTVFVYVHVVVIDPEVMICVGTLVTLTVRPSLTMIFVFSVQYVLR